MITKLEQGPELIELPTGSRVNTADETKQVLGGFTMQINKFINNTEKDIEELMEEMAFYLKKKGLVW